MSLSAVITVTVGGALPSWRPAAGNVAFINLNTAASQLSQFVGDCSYTKGVVGGETGLFSNYTSGVYSPYWGSYGAITFQSGGDGDGWANQLFVFDLNTRTFKRYGPWGPGNSSDVLLLNNTNPHDENMISATDATLNSDDRYPLVGHAYDSVGFLPPSMGGGTMGSHCSFIRTYGYKQSRSSAVPFRADIATLYGSSERYGASNPWSRVAASGPASAAIAVTGVDEVNGKAYIAYSTEDAGGLNNSYIAEWTLPQSGTPTLATIAVNHNVLGGPCTGQIWYGTSTSPGRYWLHFGCVNPATRTLAIKVYNLDNIAAGPTTLTLSGSVPNNIWTTPVCYCPDNGKFYLFSADKSDLSYIYEITPHATNPLGTWSVARKLMNGSVSPAFSDSTWSWKTFGKSMQYATKAKVVMWPGNATGFSDTLNHAAMYAYTPEGL
jgi:hypothetical protein